MLRLLSFLSTYRNTILFITLEGIALYMIIRLNDHQRHQAGDALLEVTSSFYEQRSGINRYFHLGRDNEELMAENTRLRKQLLEARKEISQLLAGIGEDSLSEIILVDSIRQSDLYSFIPCRVIKNSTSKTYNYIVLDKGSKSGVDVDMGVVSPEGIVGRVIRVTDNFSIALSALNIDFKLSLTTIDPANNNEEKNIGFYEWRGTDARHADLTYIPETSRLDTGYQVVTSGNSQIFPPGFMVGKISRIDKQTQNGFYDAQIELSANFNSLTNVYLIQTKNKAVIDSLEMNLR